MAASPNARIGRAFKTGKEELAGFITALELFVTEKPENVVFLNAYNLKQGGKSWLQRVYLDILENKIM